MLSQKLDMLVFSCNIECKVEFFSSVTWSLEALAYDSGNL